MALFRSPFALLFQLPSNPNRFRCPPPPPLLRSIPSSPSAAIDGVIPRASLFSPNRSDVILHSLPFYAPYPHQVQWLSVSRSAMSSKNPTPNVATPCPRPFFKENRTGSMDLMGATKLDFVPIKFTADCGSQSGSGSIRHSIHTAFPLPSPPSLPSTLFIRTYRISISRPAGSWPTLAPTLTSNSLDSQPLPHVKVCAPPRSTCLFSVQG